MFKFGEFAQFTPEGSWKVLKVSENVWKATHILRFIMVYHHLEPFFLYEHGQFGIPCFWTKPWSMFRQTPTGGCLACLLPSCSEQHQDFCHIVQPRGFLFQQTWGWVKNLWNTIFGEDEAYLFTNNFGVKGTRVLTPKGDLHCLLWVWLPLGRSGVSWLTLSKAMEA